MNDVLKKYSSLRNAVAATFSIATQECVDKALVFAEERMRGYNRYDGTPLFDHDVAVAEIVAKEIGLGRNSTVAAILHDVMRIVSKERPEEVDALSRTIRTEFGEPVLGIIVGLCKISNIKLKVSKEQADDFRDMIVSYSEDPRVILIKLADRLEVMRSLQIFPPEKRRKKSWESLNLYAQIAHKLGLYALKSELEDLALKWLENKDRHKTWQAEQALMQAVREGNLNYKPALSHAQNMSQGVPVSASREPLRAAKTSAVVFISLCTRAAIEGGLSPNEAYSLGDYYIQNAENCHDLSEIICCNHDMYADFIQRVHKRRSNPTYSPQIQKCCDYITFHVEKKFRIKDLAELIGYSEYYLSKKFKQETGITVNTFIRNAKIERAKVLLDTTEMDIDAIAESLNFASRGYFGEIFQQVTGVSPGAYRRGVKSN